MQKISAIIHASNDAARLGRAIESLRPCDEVLVIDHDSHDDSVKVAREHGAKVKPYIPGVEPGAYVVDANHDWIFCLRPNEAISDALEASLIEWKHNSAADGIGGYRVGVRAENGQGWKQLAPEMRLVNRRQMNWPDELPPTNDDAPQLAGELMRFQNP
jgi:glycosyltransferase involved in cell wall biosynthesis